MIGRPPITYVGQVVWRSPEEARDLVLRTLWECGGSAIRVSRVLQISRPHVYHLMRKLGIRNAQGQIRAYARARFSGKDHRDIRIDPDILRCKPREL